LLAKNNNLINLANNMADRYIKQVSVGKGSFGAVYRGIDNVTGNLVAIKVINLDEAEEVC